MTVEIVQDVERPAIMPPDWTKYGKCVGSNGDLDSLFFPPTETAARREAVDEYCTGCPVRNLCAGLKEQTNSQGFWG